MYTKGCAIPRIKKSLRYVWYTKYSIYNSCRSKFCGIEINVGILRDTQGKDMCATVNMIAKICTQSTSIRDMRVRLQCMQCWYTTVNKKSNSNEENATSLTKREGVYYCSCSKCLFATVL